MPAAVETMAYAGEVPWHGLGAEVKSGISVDKMLKAAGLDWQVVAAPMRYEINREGLPRLKGSVPDRALVRVDTGVVLDTVGPRYIPTQNAQVLEFFREYVEAGSMALDTAGSLMGGRFVWALAKMDAAFDLGTKKKPDQVGGYVLLVSPHRYGQSLITKFTPVRVVCWNTMSIALSANSPEVRIWHVKEFDEELQQQAKRNLGIATERLEAFHKNAEQLVITKIDEATAVKMATEFFGGDTGDKGPSLRASKVIELYQGAGRGSLLPTAKDTAWGFLNAVTEYFDHYAGRLQDNRLHGAWLGYGAVRKQRVMDRLLKLAA